jgi:hypothetical protein
MRPTVIEGRPERDKATGDGIFGEKSPAGRILKFIIGIGKVDWDGIPGSDIRNLFEDKPVVADAQIAAPLLIHTCHEKHVSLIKLETFAQFVSNGVLSILRPAYRPVQDFSM